MNRTELVAAIAAETGLPKATCADVIGAQARVASFVLGKGEALYISGFVKLEPITRAARTGRNPKTGAAVEIPAKKAVKAKVYDSLLGADSEGGEA